MSEITFLFFGVLILAFSVSYSQDGVLDTTFDEDGKLYLHFNGYSESKMGTVLVQPDDKIVAAGVLHNHGIDQQIFIVRYKGDGTPDGSFGANGKVETNFTGTPFLRTMILQPDNKIIVAGYISFNTPNYDTQSFLARYNADGTPDADFGEDGLVLNDDFRTSTACLQADGKIVVARYQLTNAFNNSGLIRYKTDGKVDTGFGSNGVVSTEPVVSGLLVTGVKSDSNGRLTIIGQFGTDDAKDVAIARFGSNGVLDTSFGNYGFRLFDEDITDDCSLLKILSNGRILFYVTSYHYENSLPIVHRKLIMLLSNGEYDADFGVNGRLDQEETIDALELQSDGKILAGVQYDSGISHNPVYVGITRYYTDGSLDTAFGVNGTAATSAGDGTVAYTNSIALQSDGKIIAGATFTSAGGASYPATLLLRYNSRLLGQSEFGLAKKEFVVYPNPVKEKVNIDFELGQSEVLSIDLYSNDGRKVANIMKDKDFQAGFNSQQLDFPETVAAGIYFLKVSGENETKNFRIVKK
ncbi:T9SS type A sorting domain-containing protein [Flavobacterium enshiense]|nr:T9SS type A sorting domain-containing protein [Flavobacterium enshiense]